MFVVAGTKTLMWEEFGEAMEKNFQLSIRQLLQGPGWGNADLNWGFHQLVEGVHLGFPSADWHLMMRKHSLNIRGKTCLSF